MIQALTTINQMLKNEMTESRKTVMHDVISLPASETTLIWIPVVKQVMNNTNYTINNKE